MAERDESDILRQLGHLDLLRPAAFRPFLTEGLALSGTTLYLITELRHRQFHGCATIQFIAKEEKQGY